MPQDPASLLSSPDLGSPIDSQVDWLELVAFFRPYGVARLDELVAQQDLEWNYEPEDLAEIDSVEEDIAAQAAAEVQARSEQLGNSYPFEMSPDGNHVKLLKEWNVGQAVYLFSLIMSHTPRSELVPETLAPQGNHLKEARDIFQICSTLAAAGRCEGPSFSIGWPRPDSSSFLVKLKEIWSHFGDGQPRDEPLPGTPPTHKDEGIDVVAWWPERDKQAGVGFLLGQVASGNDWKEKSVVPHANRLLKEWFTVQPVSQFFAAIFIPFKVADQDMRRASGIHGYVVHRGRLPSLAEKAIQCAAQGVAPIERLEEASKIQDWLKRHLATAVAV